jgi:hypothetical protein
MFQQSRALQKATVPKGSKWMSLKLDDGVAVALQAEGQGFASLQHPHKS